ncbi:MAG: ATP-binding protein, partial [Bacteroidota bacterium]
MKLSATYLTGKAQFQLRRFRRAVNSLEDALPMAQAQKDTLILLDLYQLLSQAHFQRKNQEESLHYNDEYTELSQELLLRRKQERLDALKGALEEERELSSNIQLEALQNQLAADSAFGILEVKEDELLRQNLALVELQMKISEAERSKMFAENQRIEAENLRIEAERQRLEAEYQLEHAQLIRQYWIGGTIIVSLLLIGFFVYRQQRITRAREVALERERAERLEQIDGLKDQFLANTSHELRTPLNGIIGLSEGLLDQIAEDPDGTGVDRADLQTSLGMVVASGKRLASLVNDLLDFSRIRHADLQLRQRPTDLRTLTEVVLNVSYPLTQGKDLVLVNEVPEDLPAIFADEDRLTQILHNLIGNSIKFTESGAITVSAKVKGGMMAVQVRDTGIGIPPEKLDSIFEAFTQADGSIARQYSGTGLGLSITKYLVEQHGGEIWAQSQIDQGSTFFLT